MNANGLLKVCAGIFLAGFCFSSNVEAQADLAHKHFERGAMHHLNGNNDKAIAEFKKSLRYDKEHANTHFYLALVYEVKGNNFKALKHMLKAEKYFEMEGREYWKERSRKRIEEYYVLFGYKREDFEK
ncbi:MAG: hypothetical protein VW455_03320 [Nitrospinota bacterium]